MNRQQRRQVATEKRRIATLESHGFPVQWDDHRPKRLRHPRYPRADVLVFAAWFTRKRA